ILQQTWRPSRAEIDLEASSQVWQMQVVHFLMVFAPMSELEGMLVRKFKFDLADTSHSLRTAFGGFGFTSRMWGLTLDTVKAINTVLANGTIIRATAENHPDLFWGLRGSASSFGITASIEVAAPPAPSSATIFRYTWDLNVSAAAQGLAAFQAFAETDIPAHFGGEINLSRGSSSGTVTFELLGGWYAPVEGLNSTLAPLLSQMPDGPKTSLQTGTYLNSSMILAGQSLDTTSAPDGHDTFYAKSLMTPESEPISEKALLAFVQYIANEGFTSQMEWFVQFELYGGKNSAINSVAPDATAFAHRSSLFTIQFYASAPGKAPPFPSDGFTFLDACQINVIYNTGRQRYYGSHYARLRSLKDKYDPDDVFKFPTSIEE
ncbi:hypothetical protein C0993_002150, partial [Termitomyces sp. T159_Od127]